MLSQLDRLLELASEHGFPKVPDDPCAGIFRWEGGGSYPTQYFHEHEQSIVSAAIRNGQPLAALVFPDQAGIQAHPTFAPAARRSTASPTDCTSRVAHSSCAWLPRANGADARAPMRVRRRGNELRYRGLRTNTLASLIVISNREVRDMAQGPLHSRQHRAEILAFFDAHPKP
jgi:hypothetical protein